MTRLGYHTNTWGPIVGHPAGVTNLERLHYVTRASMATAIADIAAAGFEGVELFDGNLVHDRAETAAALTEHGVALVAVYCGGSFIYPDALEPELAKIDGVAVEPTWVEDPTRDAKVLVLGWGSTFGPIGAAVRRVRRAGRPIAQAHLRHLNPFPADLGEVLARYDRVVIPEMNMGQLALLIRGRYLVDAQSITQDRGMQFKAAELAEHLLGVIAP